DVVPSFTIGLAPVGVSIIAMLTYLPVLERATPMGFIPLAAVAPLTKLLAFLLWGFGLWWMLIAFLVTATAFKRKGVPFTLGYWAFIFPPAAYTIATLILAQATGIPFIKNTGIFLAALVSTGWAIVAILTIQGVVRRTIFSLPPSFAEILQDAPVTAALDKDLIRSNYRGKFPIYSINLAKNPLYYDLPSVAAALKSRISGHPVARHVADFDHQAFDPSNNEERPAGLKNAMNVLFCLGPKMEEPHVIAIKPRSFGIAEYDRHFTISFMEAPSDKATETMKEWVRSL
ncbi:MAG: hypothetical protein JW706_05980, partial [Opitutales bacterium]|nr:hypothetical protein [Opitutales bacterium]